MKIYEKYLNKKISSNNLEEGLFIIPGAISKIIFTKEYYTKNSDIKTFSINILNEDYKEYLFKSRTELYARIIKDIYKEKDENKVITKINNILKFISSSGNDPKIDSPRKKLDKPIKMDSKIQKDIMGWVKIINPDEK